MIQHVISTKEIDLSYIPKEARKIEDELFASLAEGKFDFIVCYLVTKGKLEKDFLKRTALLKSDANIGTVVSYPDTIAHEYKSGPILSEMDAISKEMHSNNPLFNVAYEAENEFTRWSENNNIKSIFVNSDYSRDFICRETIFGNSVSNIFLAKLEDGKLELLRLNSKPIVELLGTLDKDFLDKTEHIEETLLTAVFEGIIQADWNNLNPGVFREYREKVIARNNADKIKKKHRDWANNQGQFIIDIRERMIDISVETSCIKHEEMLFNILKKDLK